MLFFEGSMRGHKKQIKVLEISVRSDIGGGPKHLLDLLKSFKQCNGQFFSAIPFIGEYAQEIRENSTDFVNIPFRHFSLITYFKLIIFCLKNRIDIVHSHGRGAGLYSRLLKFMGVKVIHTFHGVHKSDGFIGFIKLVADKMLVPLTNSFICVSQSEFEEACVEGVCKPEKTVVIHNGVHIPEARIASSNEVLTMGTLARFSSMKGLDILVKYVDLFKGNHPEQKFIVKIAGDGEDFLKIKNLIKDKGLENEVLLLGQTTEPENFLRTLDIYISTSRYEGMPLAVLEAMSIGLPVICSNVVGNKDLIIHGVDGILFELENFASFEQNMLEILKDENKRNDMGSQARRKTSKKFSLEKMAEKTYQIYI